MNSAQIKFAIVITALVAAAFPTPAIFAEVEPVPAEGMSETLQTTPSNLLRSIEGISLRKPDAGPKIPQFTNGSLIVKFRSGVSPDSVKGDIAEEFQFTEVERLFLERHQADPLLADTYELKIPENANPALAAEAYKKLEEKVEYAEPNFFAETNLTQRLHDPLYNLQWHLPKISAPNAWAITQGSSSTVIAVIDSGVYWSHPDLAQNIWKNSREIPNNGKDDDNNGFIDDDKGWDFVETYYPLCSNGEDCLIEDNDPNDYFGHGTHVAGISAAVTNNKIGVAGICQNCKIMNVRAGFAIGNPPFTGALEFDDVIQSIVYAADNGAKVINMSFSSFTDSASMANVINYAYQRGVNLVAAAGNNRTDERVYPAAYPQVIAVAATGESDQMSFFSTYGGWVDIAAPGENILSTVIPGVQWGCKDTLNGYGICTGTSMASPVVAGVIGLAISANPSLNQQQIFTLIQSSYDAVTAAGYRYQGPGRINAYKAARSNSVPIALLDESLPDLFISSVSPVNIYGTASGTNFTSYRLDIGFGEYPNVWTNLITSQTPVANGLLGVLNPPARPSTYILKLTVIDGNQREWEDRTLIYVDTTLVPGWPKQIGARSLASAVLADVDGDNDGEVFFQAASISFGRLLANFYAIDHNGAPLNSNWPITITTPYYMNSFNDGYPYISMISPAVDNIDADQNSELVFTAPALSTGMHMLYVYEPNGFLQSGWPVAISPSDKSAIWSSPVIANVDGGTDKEIIVTTVDFQNPINICGNLSISLNKVYIYKNNGQLLPGWPQTVNCWTGYASLPVAVGDVNADGNMDIVVASASNNFPNSADTLYVFDRNGVQLPGWPKQIRVYASPVLADIDRNDNGKLEIMVTVITVNDREIYAFNDDGTVVPGWPRKADWTMPSAGNFDSDADLEILIGGYSASRQPILHAYNHDGTYVPGWPIATSRPGYPAYPIETQPFIADLDGDGLKEVITVSGRALFNDRLTGNKVYAFHLNGAPMNNFPKRLPYYINDPAIGNLDGDNLMDIFMTDWSGRMYRWELTGAATSSALEWPQFHHDPQHTGKYP